MLLSSIRVAAKNSPAKEAKEHAIAPGVSGSADAHSPRSAAEIEALSEAIQLFLTFQAVILPDRHNKLVDMWRFEISRFYEHSPRTLHQAFDTLFRCLIPVGYDSMPLEVRRSKLD